MTKTLTVAGVLLALMAGPALAQRDGDRSTGPNTEGFYLGAGVGDFSSAVDEINSLDDVDDAGIDFSDSDNAKKIFAGWRFNRFVSVQADFVDFGEASGFGSSDVQGIAPSVVGTLPIGPVELFARVGLMFYEVDLNLTGGRIIDESGEDLLWAAGLGIDIFDRVNLRLEYEGDRHRRARRSRRSVAQRRLEVLACWRGGAGVTVSVEPKHRHFG